MKLDVCAASEAMLLFALPSYYQQKEVHEKSWDPGQAHSRKGRLLHVVGAWCAPGERQERWLTSFPSLSARSPASHHTHLPSQFFPVQQGAGLADLQTFLVHTAHAWFNLFSISSLSEHPHRTSRSPHFNNEIHFKITHQLPYELVFLSQKKIIYLI